MTGFERRASRSPNEHSGTAPMQIKVMHRWDGDEEWLTPTRKLRSGGPMAAGVFPRLPDPRNSHVPIQRTRSDPLSITRPNSLLSLHSRAGSTDFEVCGVAALRPPRSTTRNHRPLSSDIGISTNCVQSMRVISVVVDDCGLRSIVKMDVGEQRRM
jgi:hypothetical protein